MMSPGTRAVFASIGQVILYGCLAAQWWTARQLRKENERLRSQLRSAAILYRALLIRINRERQGP